MNDEHDISLSYNHKDEDWVNSFKEALEGDGSKIWGDKEKILLGDSILDEIDNGMNASKAIVVITPASINSPWVKEEYKAAIWAALNKSPKRAITLIFNDAELSYIFPKPFTFMAAR
jgi:hypothetical protein